MPLHLSHRGTRSSAYDHWTLGILACWLLLELFYLTFGSRIVTALYDRTFPISALHQLVAHPGDRPLSGYLVYASATYTYILRTASVAFLLASFFAFKVLPFLCARQGRPTLVRGLPWGAGAGFLSLAWMLRFIQDDAFISFTYADRLVRGQGLTWSDGIRIEGYTNFLWTLLIAAGQCAGLDPIAWSWTLGLGCFLLSLALTWRLCARLLGDEGAGALALLLLGTNFTFLSYATGGLETQLQACLIVAVAWMATHLTTSAHAIRWAIAMSFTGAAAVATRLDSVLPMIVLFIWTVARISDATPHLRRLRLIIALLLPGAVAVGSWLLWKLSYYGEILPNTFTAKVASGRPPLEFGFSYAWAFLHGYLLWPLLLVALVSLVGSLGRRYPALWASAAVVILWFGYIIWVGGDFMEFRLMVPVIPFIVTLVVAVILLICTNPALRLLFVGVLLGASFHHGLRFRPNHSGVDDIRTLDHFITWDYISYRDIGQALRIHLAAEDQDLLVATTAVGAIAYYSRLPILDMHGLNDREIARHGRPVGRRPGHQRLATGKQLIRRGVHLVIGMPVTAPWDRSDTAPPEVAIRYLLGLIEDQPVPADARILELPMNRTFAVFLLQLRDSPAVDDAIRRGVLRVYSPSPSPMPQVFM